ncbi:MULTISPECIES: peptide pheromone VP1 [Streptococcus]|uniref:peptide pheromone VP1 n=1 Tax=Streptococcus TaxID=1301 RepID=UPI001CBB8C81|nr:MULTISPECIES: peptide pheromone VP1 [Streptococcus]MBZ2099220.1 peptide pheromone VP1 [Streptococcus mitis]MBZ2104923.1 peptide pheromone VP1 [Streptococcus mitis]MBZ2108459.1 peptide pheromone VP1 [Streptococcus mitis]MBZ2110805.1 peptide pheromone VP1 [Streptococcus infantis]MBZ2112517.1 peptide pheromone VP1 [Streptococcus infantis]
MLNLQVAETMELTEAELETVRGGELINTAIIPGGGNWGGFGTPWSITNFWKKNFNDKPDSDSDRRRY